jgi:hypothetical protein
MKNRRRPADHECYRNARQSYRDVRHRAMLDLVSDPREVVYAADVLIAELERHWHREEKNANTHSAALEQAEARAGT